MRLLSLALMGSACALRIPTVQHAPGRKDCTLRQPLLSFAACWITSLCRPATIEEVIVESTVASYPILEALDEGFPDSQISSERSFWTSAPKAWAGD